MKKRRSFPMANAAIERGFERARLLEELKTEIENNKRQRVKARQQKKEQKKATAALKREHKKLKAAKKQLPADTMPKRRATYVEPPEPSTLPIGKANIGNG